MITTVLWSGRVPIVQTTSPPGRQAAFSNSQATDPRHVADGVDRLAISDEVKLALVEAERDYVIGKLKEIEEVAEKVARLERASVAVAQKDARVAQLESDLALVKRNAEDLAVGLRQIEEAAAQKDARIAQSEGAMAQKDTRVAQLESDLAVAKRNAEDLAAALRQIEGAVAQEDARIAQSEGAMAQKDTRVAQLESDLALAKKNGEDLVARLRRLDDSLAQKVARIARSEGDLSQTRKKAQGLAVRLQQIEAAVAQKDVRIGQIEAVLAQKDAQIARSESDLSQARKNAQDLAAWLRQIEATVAQKDARIAQASDFIADISGRYAATRRGERKKRFHGFRRKRSKTSLPASASRRAFDAICDSVLFSREFYLGANPDVKATGVDPALHYFLHGGAEGRDPCLFFSTADYLEQNPDVAAGGTNPLVHYERFGRDEGRPICAPRALRVETDPGGDSATSEVSAAPAPEAIAPLSFADDSNPDVIARSPLFDPNWYLATYADVAQAGIDPALHYLQHGGSEGRDPGPSFSTADYLQRNPDVAAAGVNPLVHYEGHGRGEGRPIRAPHAPLLETDSERRSGVKAALAPEAVAPPSLADYANPDVIARSPLFDPNWYLTTYADVAQAGIDPALHYLQHGGSEGRDPGPSFSTADYLEQNRDVAAAGMNPLVHYERHGRGEGRPICVALRSRDPQADEGELGVRPDISKRPLTDSERITQKQNLRPNGALRPSVVAVGVVAYNNGFDELKRCFASAQIALQSLPFEAAHMMLTIDNGEPTDPALVTAHGFTSVESRGNIGFGAAHNVLMVAAFEGGADYYIATNPDGVFHPECVTALVEMAQASDDGAIVEALQFPEEHPKVYDPVTFNTPWASGACMLIPRPVYALLGGFDDNFFMYCEDVDLSWRARGAGLKVKTCPRAIFFHPVIDRPFDATVHARFLTSGIVLARKWGELDFEKGLIREADRLNLRLGQIPAPRKAESTVVADFDHLFSFAQTRW